jgi:hypothetical protein
MVAGGGFEPPTFGLCDLTHLSMRVGLNRYFGCRYPQTHYYLLYFAVRTSDQTYCAEYDTPVLDEIDDLIGRGLWPTKGKGGRRQKSRLQNESALDSAITLSPRVTGSLKNSCQTVRLAVLVCEYTVLRDAAGEWHSAWNRRHHRSTSASKLVSTGREGPCIRSGPASKT